MEDNEIKAEMTADDVAREIVEFVNPTNVTVLQNMSENLSFIDACINDQKLAVAVCKELNRVNHAYMREFTPELQLVQKIESMILLPPKIVN